MKSILNYPRLGDNLLEPGFWPYGTPMARPRSCGCSTHLQRMIRSIPGPQVSRVEAPKHKKQKPLMSLKQAACLPPSAPRTPVHHHNPLFEFRSLSKIFNSEFLFFFIFAIYCSMATNLARFSFSTWRACCLFVVVFLIFR